jgi:hypothetical protein
MNTDFIPEVMRMAFDRSVTNLRNLPTCAFKIYFNGSTYDHDPEGIFTARKVQRKKRVPRTEGLKHGELTVYIKKYVDGLQMGDYAEVPFVDPITNMKYHPKSLASSCASVLCRLYGPKSFTTYRNDAKQCVEIFIGSKN